MKQCLLDEMAERMCLTYISDLKHGVDSPGFVSCIDSIPKGVYPLEEWRECVDYLISGHHSIKTEEDARQCLTVYHKPIEL